MHLPEWRTNPISSINSPARGKFDETSEFHTIDQNATGDQMSAAQFFLLMCVMFIVRSARQEHCAWFSRVCLCLATIAYFAHLVFA